MYFLCSQNKMYYSDYVLNHIYSATLDTGGDVELLLNDSVEVPGKHYNNMHLRLLSNAMLSVNV